MSEDAVAPEQYLTVRQAAKLLSVHPSTIRRWIDQGYLLAYRLGPKRIGVKPSDLAEIAELRSPRNTGPREPEISAVQIRSLSEGEQKEWKQAISAARELQAEILAKRGGKLFTGSSALIDEARDNRTRELSRVAGE